MKFPEVEIGDLASSESGAFKIGPFGSSLKKDEIFKEGIPVVGIENVLNNEFVPPFRRHIREDKYRELHQYTIRPGDVLVTTMGTIGFAAVVPNNVGRMIIDSHLFRMRVDQSKVYPHYLCYAINYYDGIKQHLQQMSRGAIMEGLNTTILKECKLPLPSFPEQQRISTILAKADRLRRLRRYALELSGTYLQAVFLEMFGDPVTNPKGYQIAALSEQTDIQGGYAFKSGDFTDSGIPVIRIGTVNSGSFDKSNLVYLPESFSQIHKKFLLYPGDLVMTLTGTVGKDDYANVCVLGTQFHKYFLNQRVAKITANPEIFTSEYILYVFRNPTIKQKLTNPSRGVRQANISNDDILSLQIPLPPLPFQQQFVHIVQKYTRIQAQQQEALRQAEHLFQTLLHKAFQGELSEDEIEEVAAQESVVMARQEVVVRPEPVNVMARQLALPLE